MSVKNESSVDDYVADVAEIHKAIAKLQEFADSLHVPDENHELGNMHYGHVGSVQEIANRLKHMVEHTEDFWTKWR